MLAAIWVAPHERYEAVVAYRDRLTPEMIEQILKAPEGAALRLCFEFGEQQISQIQVVHDT